MKKILPLMLILATMQLKSQTYTFTYDGILRDYIVHLPTGYNPTNKYPLVINMHGLNSSASEQQVYSQMDAVADTGKFIAVYPNGVNKAWNAGFDINSTIDDVGFLSALIDTMNKNFSVDTTRVYSCGMSNGGFMSYRLACQLENKIAAIASVTGLMADSVRLFCQNSCGVPVMDFHGTTDAIVYYNGASPGYVSVDSTMKWWAQKNGCLQTPVITAIPDTNTSDLCTAEKYFYGACQDSAEVILFKITNGGHTWPGAIPVPGLGNTNQDFNAGGEIWNFFKKHQLRCLINSVKEEYMPLRSISVYANPFSEVFYIKNVPADVKRISILNLPGQIIEEINLKNIYTDEPLAVYVKNISGGFYFLKIEAAAGISVLKIVCSN